MINIGCYILDQEEMTLNRDGDSVKLEPKVLAVLTYFYQNENRYISIAELHENVWHDRCVSDAAVRRIIGKLRVLFNDDHKAPKYIQSLPKRGYKLICQTSFSQEGDAITSETKLNTQPKEQKVSVAEKAIRDSNIKITRIASHLLEKLSGWGNKTFIILFLTIIFLFFIGPLAYRIDKLIT